jgi:hypothetical protein
MRREFLWMGLAGGIGGASSNLLVWMVVIAPPPLTYNSTLAVPNPTRYACRKFWGANHPAGLMFGLRRKKLSGSYFFFSATNRS